MSEGPPGRVGIAAPRDGAERRATRAVLARAFLDDPVWAAIGPRFSRRWRAVTNRASFWATIGASLGHEGARVRLARVRGRPAGATIAFAPGRWPLADAAALRELAWVALAGPVPARRGIRVDRAMRASHIVEPHTYLWFIGVEPDLQGAGVGSALIDDLHGWADPLGLPTYLETGTEANVLYYGRRGYEVVGEIPVPESGVRMWRMLRPPG